MSIFVTAVQDVLEALSRWESSDSPMLEGRKMLSEELSRVIEDVINATADEVPTKEDPSGFTVQTIEPGEYEVCLLFDKLAAEYRTYKRMMCAALSISELNFDADAPLWRSIYAIKEFAQTTYNYQKPMGIATYRSQSVSDEQIARIYGWKHPDGSPDVNRVAEEADKPGTHYDAKTWVHPAKQARISAATDMFRLRDRRRAEYEDPSTFGKTAPPSVEELVRLGAPPEQIARLHGIEIADAEELLRAGSVDSPGEPDRNAQMTEQTTLAGARKKPAKQ